MASSTRPYRQAPGQRGARVPADTRGATGWDAHRRSSIGMRGAAPRQDRTRRDEPISTVVREVLDYFQKCPVCGYPAEASVTTRLMASGRVETELQPRCGLPCGWIGPSRPSAAHASTFPA